MKTLCSFRRWRSLWLGALFAVAASPLFAQTGRLREPDFEAPPSPENLPVVVRSDEGPVERANVVAEKRGELAEGAERRPVAPVVWQPDAPAASAPNNGIDPQLAAVGEGAFERSCTSCHDSAKSMEKSKSLGQWRATVRRMASKDGADISERDIEPIAAYLATSAGGGVGGAGGEGDSPVTIFGTISPTWRGGNDNLQNGGFFPDAWIGASFQNGSAISGRVSACVSCHTEAGEGSRLEIVEAAGRIDLLKAMGCSASRFKASADFGRVIVPFGAFAQQSNPGVYRTVTKPLIYNMGMRVYDEDLGDAVLPMPYADEGLVFNVGGELTSNVSASWDVYTVNGLQAGTDGIDFDMSRDYVGINNNPSLGTRLTLGNERLKFGSSLISGQASPTGGVDPIGAALYYRIYGFDAVYRLDDIFRLQFEYARRDSDRVIDDPVLPFVTRDNVGGYYIEGEVLLLREQRLSFLARYDQQDRHSIAPPPESTLADSSFRVSRFTYGLNWVLPGGSLLMVNHERWNLPSGLGHLDVIGARWALTF